MAFPAGYHLLLILKSIKALLQKEQKQNKNYNFEVGFCNASLINSLLNTLPCALFGIASMNRNFLIFLYGATYNQYFTKPEIAYVSLGT